MAQLPNDDLFEKTKMSFGQHLEELRVCLFRAVVGLAIGFSIGLFIGHRVVSFIQEPLRRAMINHTIEKKIRDLEKEYKTNLSKDTSAFIRNHQVIFKDVFFETDEIRRLAKLDLAEGPAEPLAESPTKPANEKEEKEATSTKSETTAKDDETTANATSPNVNHPKLDGIKPIGGEPASPRALMVKSRVWEPIDLRVTALRADEAFMIWMKAGFISGFIIASPWIFYQIWQFIAAGLYPHERKYIHIFLPMSLSLFLAGAALAFFFVFDPVLQFLFSFNESMNIGIDARISEWLSFVLIMPLGFGLSFQLPLVMLFLNRIGFVSLAMYVEKWRIAVLAVFVISMILTPADPISMLLMAVPLTFLYFFGVALCKWMPTNKSPLAE